MNTRKKLHKEAERRKRERREDALANETYFRFRHSDEMRKMLRRIDPERTIALAEGRLP